MCMQTVYGHVEMSHWCVYVMLLASQLDDMILHVHNNTDCPCSVPICKGAPGGYRIAVAIVGSMWLDPALRYRASSPVEWVFVTV